MSKCIWPACNCEGADLKLEWNEHIDGSQRMCGMSAAYALNGSLYGPDIRPQLLTEGPRDPMMNRMIYGHPAGPDTKLTAEEEADTKTFCDVMWKHADVGPWARRLV